MKYRTPVERPTVFIGERINCARPYLRKIEYTTVWRRVWTLSGQLEKAFHATKIFIHYCPLKKELNDLKRFHIPVYTVHSKKYKIHSVYVVNPNCAIELGVQNKRKNSQPKRYANRAVWSEWFQALHIAATGTKYCCNNSILGDTRVLPRIFKMQRSKRTRSVNLDRLLYKQH